MPLEPAKLPPAEMWGTYLLQRRLKALARGRPRKHLFAKMHRAEGLPNPSRSQTCCWVNGE